MVYPENFESKIKFDKIRQFVQKNCLSDMGRDLVEAMKFSTEPTEIRERLEETQEFMSILEEEDQFPGDHFSDARPFLNKVRVEGLFLEVAEMVALKQSLESLTAIVRFFHGKDERYPRLTAQAGDIQLFPYILQRLDSIVSRHGSIKDTALPLNWEISAIGFNENKTVSPGVCRLYYNRLRQKGGQKKTLPSLSGTVVWSSPCLLPINEK